MPFAFEGRFPGKKRGFCIWTGGAEELSPAEGMTVRSDSVMSDNVMNDNAMESGTDILASNTTSTPKEVT